MHALMTEWLIPALRFTNVLNLIHQFFLPRRQNEVPALAFPLKTG